MKIISEYKLEPEVVEGYEDRGIDVHYGYETDIHFRQGESVGFLLKDLYKSTIDRIGSLLYFKHKVSLKYEGQTYVLGNLMDWKHTYQSDTDSLKQVTKYHPIYQIYLDKRKEYIEKQKAQSLEKQYEFVYEYLDPQDTPNYNEMTKFVQTFSYLYDVQVDYESKLDVMKAYVNLKYYLDNDVPYANEPRGINPDDELMFSNIQFKIDYEEPIEVESFGNETYLEDYIYKNSETSCNAL